MKSKSRRKIRLRCCSMTLNILFMLKIPPMQLNCDKGEKKNQEEGKCFSQHFLILVNVISQKHLDGIA